MVFRQLPPRYRTTKWRIIVVAYVVSLVAIGLWAAAPRPCKCDASSSTPAFYASSSV